MSAEAFYHNPEFWVAASFVGFVVLAARPIAGAVGKALDSRSARIESELAEARRLREEAQTLLSAYQQKQEESLAEAEKLLDAARAEAERMAKQSEAETRQLIEKRMKMAVDRVSQAETKALQDVQNHVVDIAVSVARTVMAEHLARNGNDDIVKQAAADLERKLH